MRAANPADADATIDRLKDIGYLNDQRFAESFASARVENEGFGRMRVLSDLRARRVPGTLAEQAVEQALEGKSEAELIDSYIRAAHALGRRGRANRGRAKAGQRLPQAAARRIYFGADTWSALKGLAARPELLEEPIEEEEPSCERVYRAAPQQRRIVLAPC